MQLHKLTCFSGDKGETDITLQVSTNLGLSIRDTCQAIHA